MGLILSMKNKEIKNMEVMYMNAGDKNIAVRKGRASGGIHL